MVRTDSGVIENNDKYQATGPEIPAGRVTVLSLITNVHDPISPSQRMPTVPIR